MTTLCDDVLYKIFDHLTPSYEARRKDEEVLKRSLLHAAMACRRFANPALCARWKVVHGADKEILGLLRALEIVVSRPSVWGDLPSYAWNTSEVTDGDVRTHPNWERFQQYATRIRHATVNIADILFPTHRPIWRQLQHCLQPANLLPCLGSVTLLMGPSRFGTFIASLSETGEYIMTDLPSTRWMTYHEALFNFISPTIRHITISAEYVPLKRDIIIPSFVLMVRDVCDYTGHLASLEIQVETCTGSDWKPDTVDVDLNDLVTKSNLRSITLLIPLRFTKIQQLSHLRGLRHLSLGEHVEVSASITFKLLSSLEIRGDTAARLHATITAIRAPLLDSLAVHATKEFPACSFKHTIHELCTTIASSLSTVSILRLTVPVLPAGRAWVNVRWLVDALRTLGGLRELSVDLESTRPYSLDTALRSFPQYFPRIEVFDLDFGDEQWNHFSDGKLDVLETIAHGCPSLRVLRLPSLVWQAPKATPATIEVSNAVQLEKATGTPPPHRLQDLALQVVELGNRRLDWVAIDAYIESLFPYASW